MYVCMYVYVGLNVYIVAVSLFNNSYTYVL